MRLIEQIRRVCERDRSKPCLMQGDTVVRYGELFARASEYSKTLEEAGLKQGDLACLIGESSIDFVIALLGCTISKVVVLPVAADLPEAEMEKIIDTVRPSSVLFPNKNDISRNILSGLVTTSSTSAIQRRSQPRAAPRELAEGGFIRYSSGTTGEAKGVCLSQERAFERVEAVREIKLISEEDVILLLLPLPYHYIVSLFLFLTEGSTLVLPRNSNPTSQADLLTRVGITTIYAAPFQIDLLTGAIPDDHSLRFAMSTSMPLGSSTAERFSQRTGTPIVQLLGNIETGLPFANLRLSSASPCLLGDPLPSIEVSVRDEDGRVVDDGASGLLYMRGPGFFNCYLEPYQSAESISPGGWFTTGDIVRRESTGAYRFCGRLSTALNIAGHKVFPEEIEESLIEFEEVEAAQVYAVPHDLFGGVLIADVVLRCPELELDRLAIRRTLRIRLAPYKVPSEIRVVSALDRTITGKITRRGSHA